MNKLYKSKQDEINDELTCRISLLERRLKDHATIIDAIWPRDSNRLSEIRKEFDAFKQSTDMKWDNLWKLAYRRTSDLAEHLGFWWMFKKGTPATDDRDVLERIPGTLIHTEEKSPSFFWITLISVVCLLVGLLCGAGIHAGIIK